MSDELIQRARKWAIHEEVPYQLQADFKALADELEEKREIDALIGESVAHQETQAFAAECLKLQAEVERWRKAAATSDERACRWEDKVQRYGAEVDQMREELRAARKVAAVAERADKELHDDCGGCLTCNLIYQQLREALAAWRAAKRS